MALNLGDIIVRLGLDTGQFTREMRQAQRQIQGAASGFRTAGQTATMAFTLPLVAAGAAALKFASDFDSAMTQSMAIMSEFSTRSELTAESQVALRSEMELVARTVAKDLNLAANDAAKSYFFLTSAGMDAQQSMAALPQVAAFAKAGMFDFATATDLATDAQSALGLKSVDVAENLAGLTRVTDVLVRANQLANASVEQFSLSLTTKAGAALKVANKSIEEGVAVLAAFADQGIKAQHAGTALNIVLRDLSTKALKNSEAFAALGVEVFDQNDNYNNMADIIGNLEDALEGMSDAQKKATLLQLGFADKSVIFLQTLLGTSDAMRGYQKALEDAGGAAQEVADNQLKAFNEQLGMTWRRIQDAAISLGSKLMPIVLDFVIMMDPLIKLLEMAVSWFARWPKFLQVAAVGMVALVAAIGPLLVAIGFIGQGIASLIAIWPAVVAAFGWVTATAIPAVVAALKVAVVYITGTVIPAVASFAVAIGPALLAALAALAAGFVAFELTSWILEITGAQERLDRFADSLFNVQRVAGEAMPTFLSKEDLALIELAEKTLGQVFSRTAEGRREAVGAMHEYQMAIRAGVAASEAVAIAVDDGRDTFKMFADALGISKEKLDQVAKSLGTTTKELIKDEKFLEKSRAALEKMAKAAADVEKRLRGMVKTVGEATKDAAELAKAVELEGGAMALTREETLRLAAMIEILEGNNIEVAESLQEVTERALELARAEREASIAAHVFEIANQRVGIATKETEQAMRDLGEELETKVVVQFNSMEEGLHVLGVAMGLTDEETKKMADGILDSGEKFEHYGSIIQDVAAIFDVFGISAQSGLGMAIGAMSGLISQIPGLLNFKKSALGAAKGLSAQFSIAAAGIAQGAASIGAFTAEGTTASRTAKGAAAGASAGSFAGIYGTIIGGAIGALVGFFRGKGAAQAAQAIESVLGQTVSENLNKVIRETAKSFDIEPMVAATLHLGDAWAEAGGVIEFGAENALRGVQNLIDFTVRGEIPMTAGLAKIGEAFMIMAQDTMEAGGLMSAEMFQIIRDTERLGKEIPAIVEFMQGQIAQATVGVTALVGEKREPAEGAAGPVFGGIQVVTEADAAAQAEIFSTTFFAAIEEFGILAAVEAMGPAFDVLKEKLEGFGAADLGGLQRFFDIARDPQFGPLIEGVQGLSDTLAGAANAGFLTHDMFFAIQQQGQSAFEQLTAAGLTNAEAYQQMAPLLQNIIDASIEYGIPIDANTAKLIEQAEASGVAFSTDPQSVMVDVLIVIAELLGATEEQLNGIGKAADVAGGEMGGMGKEGESSLKDIAAAGESSAKVIEESYMDMSLQVGTQFGKMGEAADKGIGKVADVAGQAASQVGAIGDAAADSADQFNQMAVAAGNAAKATGSIPKPPGGSEPTPMQHGGLVTKPMIALLGEAGPELVIPVSDLGESTTPEPAGAEGFFGGSAPTMNFDFSGAVIGDPYQTAQLLGEAIGIALKEDFGGATTGAEEGLARRI